MSRQQTLTPTKKEAETVILRENTEILRAYFGDNWREYASFLKIDPKETFNVFWDYHKKQFNMNYGKSPLGKIIYRHNRILLADEEKEDKSRYVLTSVLDLEGRALREIHSSEGSRSETAKQFIEVRKYIGSIPEHIIEKIDRRREGVPRIHTPCQAAMDYLKREKAKDHVKRHKELIVLNLMHESY